MRFSRPPQLFPLDELSGLVRQLIVERWPESDSLDYKEVANTKTIKERIELAKDISSFANDLGGTLVYGVPQIEENGVPIPAALEKCGFTAESGMPELIENILLDTIRPILPNLFVKLLTLTEIKPRSLLIVHHSASWNKPHMVEAYKERRYFRRGNYRAVKMSEREVEAAYASRRSFQVAAEEWFRNADLGQIPSTGRFLQMIVFPALSLIRRDKMKEETFRKWLTINAPGERSGEWVPFLDGVRFLSNDQGALNGHLFELRLFHNGAIAFTTDIELLLSAGKLNITSTKKVVELYSLIPAAKAFELLGITSPLTVKVNVIGAIGLHAVMEAGVWFGDPTRGPSALQRNPTTFCEESSTEELLGQRDQLLARIVDRLASAFGMWRSR